MGWAYWDQQQVILTDDMCFPNRVGLLRAPRKLDLTERARWLANELTDRIGNDILFIPDIVCEYPSWHGGPLGWQTGDLQKLVFLVGVMAGFFSDNHFTPVTPKEWKGQLPKSVVVRRLIKRFGTGVTATWERDMWDAVGIGLWKLGQF